MATCNMASCGSRVTAFGGSRLKTNNVRVQSLSSRNATGAVMMKKGIHPEWHPEAPVMCNGVEVMKVGGTKELYKVDIYSGNHPFYNGVRSMMMTDEGQLNKFKKKFADLGELSEIGAAASIPGKAVDEDEGKKKAKQAGKGKRK